MIKNKLIIPSHKSLNFIKQYFKKLNLMKFLKDDGQTFKPDLRDLYRIHQFIILNKRMTALEFGCGWSTIIIKHALEINKKKYVKNISKLRKKDFFELFTIDNQKKFLKKTQIKTKRILGKGKKVNFIFSECVMTKFNRRFASEYKKLPSINPDFVYLDGPDPLSVKNSINGFNTRHLELMPMSCDLLKFEHFLCPGTLILIDGRTANARFLKENFQRKWKYIHDVKNDENLFYLDEKPLGPINKLQLKFYKN